MRRPAVLGTPETQLTFIDIPLERIEAGLRWLAGHGQVRPVGGRVGIVGVSRGTELALLVASSFPDLVGPVGAYTPSSVVWVGMDFISPPGARSTTGSGQPRA